MSTTSRTDIPASSKLTPRETGMVRALLRREAVALGYGAHYHDYNRSDWPLRLIQLERVTRKITNPMDGH